MCGRKKKHSYITNTTNIAWSLSTCCLTGVYHLLCHPVRLGQPLFQMCSGMSDKPVPSSPARLNPRDGEPLHYPGSSAVCWAGGSSGSHGGQQYWSNGETEQHAHWRLISIHTHIITVQTWWKVGLCDVKINQNSSLRAIKQMTHLFIFSVSALVLWLFKLSSCCCTLFGVLKASVVQVEPNR